MQEAFSPGYISGMQDLHRGFQNTRAWDFLEHKISQCLIDPFMISENKAWLKESWDVRSSFAELVDRAFKFQELSSDIGRKINDK